MRRAICAATAWVWARSWAPRPLATYFEAALPVAVGHSSASSSSAVEMAVATTPTASPPVRCHQERDREPLRALNADVDGAEQAARGQGPTRGLVESHRTQYRPHGMNVAARTERRVGGGVPPTAWSSS